MNFVSFVWSLIRALFEYIQQWYQQFLTKEISLYTQWIPILWNQVMALVLCNLSFVFV